MTDESIPSGALKVAETTCDEACHALVSTLIECGYTSKQINAAFAKLGYLRASPSPAIGALQWLPIESAPKNGTWLLVAGPDYTGAKRMVCRWMGDWEWESADDGFGAYINPTHWMPLPAPPAASKVEPEDKL